MPAGDGLTVEQTWDALGMRATGSNDLHVDVTVPSGALLGGVEGLALVVAQLAPHWMVASYAAVYVGVARAAVDAAVEHVNARKLGHLPAVRARIGRADAAVAAAHLAVMEAARRVDEQPGEDETNRGCGGPSCWPAPPRPTWRPRCWRRRAPRRCAAGTRWNGSTATPGPARCSRPPRTCARTGSASRRIGGDPDSEGSAPRW